MDEIPMRDERPANPVGPVAGAGSADVEQTPVPGPDASSTGESESAVRQDSPVARPALSFPADMEAAKLSDQEIAMYRRRVAEGFYNTREVASEVARRMIRRGDL